MMSEQPVTPDPKRRWYQFRLRTLLIAIVVFSAACAFVGYEFRIVSHRQSLLENARANLASVVLASECLDGRAKSTIPWIRRMMGDVAVQYVGWMGPISEEDRQQFVEAFPEADVERYL